jgi:hypothetical protein
MTIYFITILLLYIFSITEIYYNITLRTKKWMLFFTYIILVLQMGLRWETGTDWIPYYEHFRLITNFHSTSPLLTGFEYGYSIFVWLVKFISSKYSFFLLAHSLIYYLLIFKSFRKYSPNLYISLLMFYTLSMGVMGSNRQLIALAICLYALEYIKDKKTICFFIFVLIAVSIHTTAFFFIIYYFLDRNIKSYTFITIIGLAFIVGKTQLPLSLFSGVGSLIGGHAALKTTAYLNMVQNISLETKLSIIGLLKRIIFVFIFYYNRNKLIEILPYYNLMINGYIVGLILYFLFADSLLIMVNRGSLYFNIMEPLLIASQVYAFQIRSNKLIISLLLFVFAFFFFYQSISAYPDLFIPYKGAFINADYYRILH